MAHLRQQIREAAAAALSALAGGRIYQSRLWPLDAAKLPCLLVYTKDEQSAVETMGRPARLRRDLDLVIEAVAAAGTGTDDALDDLAVGIETALAGSTFSNKAKDCVLAATAIDLVQAGERQLGTARLTFRVTYRTADNAPANPV